ncbi:MAG: tetratricopeptide repeat protein [Bacteroidota bacterium]|nr:tetratricopeptide repeat protein [Bacteroidota bacterium]
MIAFVILFILITLSGQADDSVQKNIIEQVNQSTSPKEKAYTFNRLSDLYLDIDLDSAQTYADSALFYASMIGNYKQISDAWVNFGNSYFFQGMLDSAKVYYEKSFVAIRLTTDMDEIAAALNRLGLIYQAKGFHDEATDYYIKAARYYENNNNKQGMADIYNNIGIINQHFNQLEIAKTYYLKSLALFRKTQDQAGEAQVMNNLATFYTETDQTDSAFLFIRKARKIFAKINHPSDEATCNLNIAMLHNKNEPYDSVLFYLDQAETLFSIINNHLGISSVHYNRGLYYNNIDAPKAAISALTKALETRHEIGNKTNILECLKARSKAYEKIENHELALQNFKEAQAYQDSIASEKMQIRFQELQIRYETEKMDKEIILYKKQAQERRNQNIILIIGITGFMLISVLFFYLFRTKARLLSSQEEYFSQQEKMNQLQLEKKRTKNQLLKEEILKQKEVHRLQQEKYQAEIEHKSRELLTSAMHIVNKNKILSEIKNNLENITGSSETTLRIHTNALCKEIDKTIHIDSDWDQFKMHFDAVNTNFFEKLETEYPKLTKSDMKVCAYLKINLSTKEIAQIMNVSPAAVHKRFYRLRLKMKLEPNTNLTKLFMSY